ncbi:Signal peptidase I [Stackebrandtia soli]
MTDDERGVGTSEELPADAEAVVEPRRRTLWRELPILIAVALLVAILVRTFVFQSFWIPSGSMENTLQRGDRVLVNKLVYDFRDPERGEVIVFKSPMEWRSDPADEDFIKRVIAIGGDTVSYDADDERLSVNGVEVDETPFLYTDPVTGEHDTPSKDNYEFTVTVPPGRLWVMGDHRWASGDSRENYIRSGSDVEAATISVESVVGNAFLLMWPLPRWDWMDAPEPFEDVPNPNATDASRPR